MKYKYKVCNWAFGLCFDKKYSDPVELLLVAQKTIDKYPEESIQIYADDSAFMRTAYSTQTKLVRKY